MASKDLMNGDLECPNIEAPRVFAVIYDIIYEMSEEYSGTFR